MENEKSGQMMYDLMVLDDSSKWLEGQVNSIIDQINLEESKVPADHDRLAALQKQLKLLYRRCEIEAKISNQINNKYGFTELEITGTGKSFA